MYAVTKKVQSFFIERLYFGTVFDCGVPDCRKAQRQLGISPP